MKYQKSIEKNTAPKVKQVNCILIKNAGLGRWLRLRKVGPFVASYN